MSLYYADEHVTLYHGDCRDLLPYMADADLIVADPPYGVTGHAWDRWPTGWPEQAAEVSASLWCFGSMRTFLAHHSEIEAADWKLSQDIVWEKNTGSSAAADRFRRVHEHALHWYRGRWDAVHHDAPRVPHDGPHKGRVLHSTDRQSGQYSGGQLRPDTWTDDGTRIARSVLYAQNMRGKATHPTEKPIGFLTPLIQYACPPGGIVLDPFAGSGSTAVAARALGMEAVLIEGNEAYCERIAKRISAPLPFEVTS